MINIHYFSGASELEGIALGVAIAVIFLLALTFTILFYIWHFYYKKCINNGLEDKSIKKEIMAEYKDYLEVVPDKEINDKTLFLQKPSEDGKPFYFKEVNDAVEFKKKKTKISLNIILGFMYLVFLAIFALGIKARLEEGVTSYFGQSVLVIETGSMETKNEYNTYLETKDLDNQIKQYSLITLDIDITEDDMKQYDIYAFYNDKGEIIVHRLIVITTDEQGNNRYTFRGDANNASASYETSITFDKIIGRYTNYQNYILGILKVYLSSNIGLITVFFAFASALFYDIFEANSNTKFTERKIYILKHIFEDIDEQEKLTPLERIKKVFIGYNKKLLLNLNVNENKYTQEISGINKNIYLTFEVIDNRTFEDIIPYNNYINDDINVNNTSLVYQNGEYNFDAIVYQKDRKFRIKFTVVDHRK